MDTTRTARIVPRTKLAALALLVCLVASSPAHGRGGDTSGPTAVLGSSASARTMLSWAVERYDRAGLVLPPAEVSFHPADDGCGGYLGYTDDGRIDLCIRLAMEPGPQRIVLHELAHAWVTANIDEEGGEAFLTLRGLSAWADGSDPWKQRGTEQAAEIIAWGLGVGTMLPMIDGDTEPQALADAFRSLTGVDPLAGHRR
jgi:hypothetical protein